MGINMILNKKNTITLKKLEQLNKINLSTQASNFSLALLCYFILKNEVNFLVITSWILIFSMIIIFRILAPYVYKITHNDSSKAIRNLNFYRYGIFISGLMWGIGALVIYPSGNLEHIFFFVFVLMGVVAGALLVYSVDPISAFAYPTTILIPLAISLSLHLKKETIPVLLGTILYFIYVIINIKKISYDRENFIISNYELMLSEREKASNEERYKLLLNHSPIGIINYDTDLSISYHNKQFLDIMGIDADNLKTLNLDKLKDQTPVNSAKEALKGKMTKYEGLYQASFSKRSLWINAISSPVMDSENNIIGGVTILQDVTEQKNAENEIKKLAFYDPLTKLPNRRMLSEKLESTLKYAKQESSNNALMFLDLDSFKSLNDTLGHDYGDLLLKEASDRLKKCVKKRDIVARFGGDEFVILLDGYNSSHKEMSNNAEKVAQRILTTINKPFNLLENKYTTSVSIGIVIFGGDGESQKDLLKYADIAMYQAKKAGRNSIRFFDHTMQHEITRQVSIETQLREAIKNEEFILHYQPQVYENGEIYGVESLVRWQHPTRGLVFPGDFISLAEEKGLMVDMGYQILHVAFKQMAKWQKIPKMQNLNVSINISAVQFRENDFTQRLFSLIEKYQINKDLIKLELTEGTLLECSEQIIENMLILREKGIKFSLDDFGTGYSSLFYLKKLPINELKIDQTFVRDIVNDSNDYAITKTIIAIANSFEFDLIAEGVETKKQQDLLIGLKCHRFQGYYFSKPISAEELEKIIPDSQ